MATRKAIKQEVIKPRGMQPILDPRVPDPSKAAAIVDATAVVAQTDPARQQKAIEAADDDLVLAVVVNAFTLTANDSRVKHYPVGVYQMPRAHAEHWFSKAMKVEIRE